MAQAVQRSSPKLRFGIYLTNGALPQWLRLAVRRLLDAGDAELVLVIEADDKVAASVEWVPGILLRAYLAGWVDRISRMRRPADISAMIASTPRAGCSGAAATHDLDFILHCGGGAVPTGLPAWARYGVWRFADDHGPLGEHPFLAAASGAEPTIFCHLEQVSSSGLPPRLLFYGHLKRTGWSYVRTLDHALDQAAFWPMLAARRLALNGALAPLEPPPRAVAIALEPTMGRLASQLIRHLASRLWGEIFGADEWNVGLVDISPGEIVKGAWRAPRWLPLHRIGRFIADPFLYRTGPPATCLVEEFSHFSKGRIAEVTLRPGERRLELSPVLECNHHLSYPHVLREPEGVFCLPEAHESGELVLYRCDGSRLKPVRSLVQGRPIVDATITRQDQLYWLFCGLQDDHVMTNLHLFFAPTLGGPWTPHPLNPVKSDIACARPAGDMFTVEGRLYRPAQDCSMTYGGGIWLNRVDQLTPTSFSETPLVRLRPDAGSPYPLGLHTLSIGDGFCVVDGKRRSGYLISLLSLPFRLSRRLHLRRARRSFLPHSAPNDMAAHSKV